MKNIEPPSRQERQEKNPEISQEKLCAFAPTLREAATASMREINFYYGTFNFIFKS